MDQPDDTFTVAQLIDAGAQEWRQMLLHEAKCGLWPMADHAQFLCCSDCHDVAPAIPAILSRLRHMLRTKPVTRYGLVQVITPDRYRAQQIASSPPHDIAGHVFVLSVSSTISPRPASCALRPVAVSQRRTATSQ